MAEKHNAIAIETKVRGQVPGIGDQMAAVIKTDVVLSQPIFSFSGFENTRMPRPFLKRWRAS